MLGVRGRSLLHLQSHIGTDTVSWARLGAVDGHEVTWIAGDVRFASTLIHRRFDIIVTSTGTIVWLPELTNWARSIHDLLEPGAVFLIRDDHPILGAMAYEPWDVTDDYFGGGGSRTYEDSDTYTENSAGLIAHALNHQWQHDLSEIVTALLRAGLRIEMLAELPFMDWPAFPGLVRCPQGWALPPGSPRIPLNFAIIASRPT